MNITLRKEEGYYGLLFKSVKELCLSMDNARSLSLLRTRYENPPTPMPHDRLMFMITFALCFTQDKPKVKDYGCVTFPYYRARLGYQLVESSLF